MKVILFKSSLEKDILLNLKGACKILLLVRKLRVIKEERFTD